MKKTIIVAYFHDTIKELEYKHLQEFKYSIKKRNAIINNIISKGFSIMLKPSGERLIIFIDNGNFKQR